MITSSTGRLAAAGALVLLLMQCSGQMPMQGTGEMTSAGPDACTGAIQATAGA